MQHNLMTLQEILAQHKVKGINEKTLRRKLRSKLSAGHEKGNRWQFKPGSSAYNAVLAMIGVGEKKPAKAKASKKTKATTADATSAQAE